MKQESPGFRHGECQKATRKKRVMSKLKSYTDDYEDLYKRFESPVSGNISAEATAYKSLLPI